ncbi:MAG: ATP-dependent sacrificial sulfur transferase LarE [Desulfomonile sp.]|nr:ATP-dependent sacrificial sulfur transferase LarE [Desulfomonile sp.]
MDTVSKKELKLRRIIRDAANDRGVLVAFSGGVDSSLLLWEAVQSVGPEMVTAVTASAPTSPAGEVESARSFAERLGVDHLVVESDECADERFLENTPDRCYVCKLLRFRGLKRLAETRGKPVVLDGTQADDHPADRPGMRALDEEEIISPLAEAGLNKGEVRLLLERAGFADHAKRVAQPCLATRIPHGTRITLEALERVRNSESFLRGLGIETVRVRDHQPIARIVTDSKGLSMLLDDRALRDKVRSRLCELGYEYVTIDLQEYR